MASYSNSYPPPQQANTVYHCDSCRQVIPFDRPRVRCLSCTDYNSCADCHLTQTIGAGHALDHQFDIYRHGQKLLLQGNAVPPPPPLPPSTAPGYTLPPTASGYMPPQTAPGYTANPPQPQPTPSSTTPDPYWGTFVTPSNTPSPMFSRLITAIFTRFAAPSADVLRPGEFCHLMSTAGYTSAEFPALRHLPPGINPATLSPTDLASLDARLISWYRVVRLDHRTTTRTFPPAAAPQRLPAAGGMPLLTCKGLAQYFFNEARRNPNDLVGRVNALLATPYLVDGATGRPFERPLPRASLPPQPRAAAPSTPPSRADLVRAEEQLQIAIMNAKFEARMSGDIFGGWTVDSYGNRRYDPGLI